MTTGHYTVNGQIFTSKSKAIYEASRSKSKVNWYFYDEVWYNLSDNSPNAPKQLPPLDSLYKERAQQLRDKYDYLILNYSAGADSHNILMTFLNNNIKLDEIYVQRSKTVEEKVYKPNTIDTSAANLLSEWDYNIKPMLDWIAKEHPEIYINIHDVFESQSLKVYDDFAERAGQFLGTFEIIRQSSYSNSIATLLDKGKTVADIYGIDKPHLVIKDNMLFGYFTDGAVSVANKMYTLHHRYSPELFYWSVDAPLIFFAQSRLVLDELNRNPIKRKLFDYTERTSQTSIERRNENFNDNRNFLIPIIYSTRDNKFQADKSMPYNIMGRTRDIFLIQNNSFDTYKQRWEYNYKNWLKCIDTDNFIFQNTNLQRNFFSPWIKIGTLNA